MGDDLSRSEPCTSVRVMLCLPFGPANVLTSTSINAAITCRPATHGQGQQPLHRVLGDLGHRHTDPLGDRGYRADRLLLATLLHGGSFCWCSWRNARHLSHGRSQTGDRHHKPYQTGDDPTNSAVWSRAKSHKATGIRGCLRCPIRACKASKFVTALSQAARNMLGLGER
jgi:hypothetical protein